MTDLAIIEPDDEFNPDRLPWEKQKGESAKAFSAFAVYRDQGFTRSLTNAAQAIYEVAPRAGKVESFRSQMAAWSTKWRWVRRCELYDMAVDKRFREQQETERDRMMTEIARTGEALRMVGMLRLLGAPDPDDPEKMKVYPLHPEKMDAQDVARFLDLGVKLGLRALGEPTEYVKGAFLIAPATLTKMVGLVADVALRYIDEALHEAFLRDAAEATGGELPE